MTRFPGPDELTIHFAHSAYRLAECFSALRPDVKHFQTWTPEETRTRIGEGHVLVASGFWSNDLLEAASALRFIQVCAVGHDQFDKAAISESGIRLANSAGVNANAVSDHALALLLGLTRQIHVARSNQQKRHWRPMISDLTQREEELPGKTMLIYGVGTIGARVAKLAKAFDMSVLGIRRDTAKTVPCVDELHPPQEFLSLLPRADVVVLTCPLTDETRGLIGKDALAAMTKSSYLINVARGGCVDEAALVAALENGQIAGAGIDVTDPEPLPQDSSLWALENVILTPHTGGETRKYEDSVIDNLLNNLERLWRDEKELRFGIV
jgi:phosphoglycerate dehydrogenase-like enzyme